MQIGVNFMPLQPADINVQADLTLGLRLERKASSVWVSSVQDCWIKFGDVTVAGTVGGPNCIRIPKDSTVAVQFPQGTTHVHIIAGAAGLTSLVQF
jgi:hypothetical protein